MLLQQIVVACHALTVQISFKNRKIPQYPQPGRLQANQTAFEKKPVMAETDVMSLKLRQLLILGKRSLVRGHVFVVKVRPETKQKETCATKCERRNGGYLLLHLR